MKWAVVFECGGEQFWLLASAADDDEAERKARAALCAHEKALSRIARWVRTFALLPLEWTALGWKAVRLTPDIHIKEEWSGWQLA